MVLLLKRVGNNQWEVYNEKTKPKLLVIYQPTHKYTNRFVKTSLLKTSP